MKNQLRIIGGEWKRRQLAFASIDGLRPTPDRVRETLFNWLMWDIQNSNVLDLCTGSGALSFEALSRGASQVVMIEPNRTQAAFLTDNLQLLKVTSQHAKLKVATAQQVLPTLKEQFDLVFLDPPYSLDLWEELAQLADPLIKDKAFIYVEADRDLNQLKLPSSWQQIKQTKAGTVRAGLYQKNAT
ncbi:16S rRNA (guanine(966)-N(2))-methyltransferase RsmD [Acinetobacter terrae]|jgi:16S rRNA (guanine966-N2)-methyltransferase|uniref:16S rRNA (guanine(966)-N(2))-methyltransferase RsmD n=1 Tax=Acinetobacter terrae TaxID=2731247 RepID=UPI0007D84E2B|nr:16S rRNA (guanine(966)-N(2))-methyltransferase RsmD [Acinetobacter terrae]NNH16517.1 16S rRNA (guanine(966)-N(2))-methyltransferase RsmD [Acinetobacter terrae]OAL85374.1 16S rRNA (guanine(966)-N(2))-methyltransferase RsmD [Acinetobacter terrae]